MVWSRSNVLIKGTFPLLTALDAGARRVLVMSHSFWREVTIFAWAPRELFPIIVPIRSYDRTIFHRAIRDRINRIAAWHICNRIEIQKATPRGPRVGLPTHTDKPVRTKPGQEATSCYSHPNFVFQGPSRDIADPLPGPERNKFNDIKRRACSNIVSTLVRS